VWMISSSLQSRGVVRMPEIRVRLTARARRALNWSRVMRWSGERGKMMLNFFFSFA
jgi:NADH pyrophosphatase NudC (nudix superfamily)